MAEQEETQVYIKREDGTLEPVRLPQTIAERAGIYRELRKLGLDLAEIRHVWPEDASLG